MERSCGAVAALSAFEMSTPQEMSYMRFLKQVLLVKEGRKTLVAASA